MSMTIPNKMLQGQSPCYVKLSHFIISATPNRSRPLGRVHTRRKWLRNDRSLAAHITVTTQPGGECVDVTSLLTVYDTGRLTPQTGGDLDK